MKLNKALVTGATSGIGAAIVRSLAAGGFDVLAVARRENRLQDLASEAGCGWFVADARDHERLGEALRAYEPDVLVNNAGVGHGITGMEDVPFEAIQEAFDVNVVAPVKLTAIAVEGMRRRRRGHIVNIGSIAGLHTLFSAIYGGTKSAIHMFSQNLRMELRGSGIRVTEICPGRVATAFFQVAHGDADKLASLGQTGIHELQPDDIAAAVVYAVNAPAHVNIATIELLPTEQAVGGVAATPVKPSSEEP